MPIILFHVVIAILFLLDLQFFFPQKNKPFYLFRCRLRVFFFDLYMVSIFAKSGNNCQKVQITLMEEVLTDLDKEQLKTFSYATKKEETTSKALYCVLTR